jgi:hypothetical protein
VAATTRATGRWPLVGAVAVAGVVPVARELRRLALRGLEAAAQLEHRLGVDLADPALGDAEDLADLGQVRFSK